jgi:hypothetical protein
MNVVDDVVDSFHIDYVDVVVVVVRHHSTTNENKIDEFSISIDVDYDVQNPIRIRQDPMDVDDDANGSFDDVEMISLVNSI